MKKWNAINEWFEHTNGEAVHSEHTDRTYHFL